MSHGAACRRCAAKTNIIWNRADAAWGSLRHYRAFKFPVTRPYSTLCIALMESDTHHTQGVLNRRAMHDDILGRVTVRLGALYEGIVYDTWYPLSGPANEDYTPGQGTSRTRAPQLRGPMLRVRYSIRFTSEKARMLGYLQPLPMKTPVMHELAFTSKTSAKSHRDGARFALFGPTEPLGKYNWKVVHLGSHSARPCHRTCAPFSLWRVHVFGTGADGAHSRAQGRQGPHGECDARF